MAKDPSPLLGYNNNIRHKNRVFHIQTEDSGVRHPHIITHLFMDGGRILKSVKTSYAEHLGVEKMADLVRKMMKDQHKGMLIALRDGQFDPVIDAGDAPKAGKPQSPSPSLAALEAAAPSRAPEATTSVPDVAASSVPDLAFPPPAPSGPLLPAPAPSQPAIIEMEPQPHSRPFEAAPSDLQPPPANLFRPRTGGNYSTVVNPPAAPEPKQVASVRPATSRPPSPSVRSPTGRPAPTAARPPTVPPGATLSRAATAKPPAPSPASSRPGSQSPPRQAPIRRTSSPPAPPVAPPDPTSRIARRPGAVPVVAAKAPESRYASARPAAIFGQARPRGGSSIFGEDIISDKSLDEVIMSYLAEDSKDAPPKSSTSQSEPKRRK